MKKHASPKLFYVSILTVLIAGVSLSFSACSTQVLAASKRARAQQNAMSDGNELDRSFFQLPTGNGHGFTLFDAQAGRLIGFLDHPYRFLRAPADIRQNGPERRNLLEEMSFGTAHPNEDGAHWIHEGRLQTADYLEQTNIIHASWQDSSSQSRDLTMFAPFGLEKNALIAVLHGQPIDARGIAKLRFHLGANPVSPNFWQDTLEIVKLPGESITALPGRAHPTWLLRGQGRGAIAYVAMQGATSASCEIVTPKLTATSGPIAKIVKGGRGKSAQFPCVGDEVGLTLTAPLDANASFGVLIAYIEDTSHIDTELDDLERWLGNRDLATTVAASLLEWRNWRTTPAIKLDDGAQTARELKLWRQSEAVLRMAQVREPNRAEAGADHRTSQGMILASLSPGGWATGWVRDGTYATVALARTGHFAEAKNALNFFLNTEPIGKFKNYLNNYDYRISVTRYFGSGEEEADYSDQATPNVETDGWGLVLWAARQYLDQSGDAAWLKTATRDGSVYEALKKGIASAIESQLETSGPLAGIMKPDSSIWEVHQQNAKHFAYTSLTAARGLCDFAAIAARNGESADAAHFAQLAMKLKAAFVRDFVSPDGYLLGAIERAADTDTDSATAEAYGFDVLPVTSPVAGPTLKHLEELKSPGGGFQRVRGTEPYEINEWAFVDFRMAAAYLRMNRRADALVLIDRIVNRASANANLIPEMYNVTAGSGPNGAVGAYTGSIPMVGYGSGALLLSLLERDGHFANETCGESGTRP